MKIVFEIVSKVKKESADKGTKYEARFKSSEGHRLILVSETDTFQGFTVRPVRSELHVEIKNPQKTLEASP
jgi:hypothetical protein